MFTFLLLSYEFPQMLPTLLHEIIASRLGYDKFCARWVPKMVKGEHKTEWPRMDSDFLEKYDKDGDEVLIHIVRVTGGEC
jgi:hypothetical protein